MINREAGPTLYLLSAHSITRSPWSWSSADGDANWKGNVPGICLWEFCEGKIPEKMFWNVRRELSKRMFGFPVQEYNSLCTASGVTRVGDTRGGNWGCHPSIFFLKNLATFFAHRCHYHYRFLLLSLGCHPLQGVTPHLFYLSDLVSPLFFVNLPTKFFSFGCHPLEGVTRGGPPP